MPTLQRIIDLEFLNLMQYQILMILAALGAAPEEVPPALSPAEALGAFRLGPGLSIELVAAEPLVASPVAIDFGGDGRLWVCEMRDYPAGLDGHWKPGGVIKVLEDVDGDGRYDRATTFLDGLPFPTGVMAWRRGALICAAPEILYAEDVDGDGKADRREVLFRGFATENYQARVNGLSYGLDNWVYGANGLIGGAIRGMATGREVNIGGRDFRIRPDTGAMEPAAGLTQQGRVRDDWGEQFGGNNSISIQHYPLPDHYVRRNPRAAAPPPAVYVPRDADSHRVFPASRTLARFNQPQSANRITSACSPLIYRDAWLGAEYAGNAFVCEPVHNLVHREVLTPEGVTFAGHRAREEQASEFLASTDNWFRPVQVRTGPDGALWVVDMYRFVIEHPRWISPERLAALDVRAGADKGRIYRVHDSKRPPRRVPRLDGLATPDLARALDSPNGTLRDNVQRLLVHRGDHAADDVLMALARTSSRPETRMQALCTLEGLGALTQGLVRAALAEEHPGVRRQAVRLGEPWLGKDEALGAAVLGMASDPDVRVRYQIALSLGEWDDHRAGAVLGRLAVSDGTDVWIRAAILSAAARQAAPILTAVVAPEASPAVRAALVEPLVATLTASKDAEAIASALAALNGPEADGPPAPWRLAALAGLLEARPELAERDAARFTPTYERARAAAVDGGMDLDVRRAAIRLLGHEAPRREADIARLGRLLDPQSPAEVQRGAIAALGRLPDPAAAAALVSAWPRLGPALRGTALDALLARRGSAEALLAAVERGAIAPGAIDAAHRQRLVQLDGAALKTRAAAVFAGSRHRARQDVIDGYRPALAAVAGSGGDPRRGREVFGRVCASCHKLDGQGHEVGPDLAALTDTSPEGLLVAILDPNREVDARYAAYTAALKDGRVVGGLVTAETASALTLKRQEAQAEVILRSDLDDLSTSGQSFMPEGLENDVRPAEMADLIAFLAHGAERPRTFAGNLPEVVRQAADGTLRLAASGASIYGPTLTYMAADGHLGNWTSAGDRAVWSFQVEQAATYTVALEWACADESAGNAYELRIGPRTIRTTVGGTGTGAGGWSQYRSIFVGEVALTPGPGRLELRPSGAPRGALLNLRAVVLTPRSGSVYRDGTPR
jgi:putative membrane-bound dehydrogenase-like protein